MGNIDKMNSIERLKAAHKHSIRHRKEVTSSKYCGCFYCGYIFPPVEISHWIDKNEKAIGQTALCPKCSIDSVLGDKSGFSISEVFLAEMNKYWFNGDSLK